MVGFGFDSDKNDYKVVRILYRQGCCEDLLPPLVEVYSIKEGSWRKVNADSVRHCIWEQDWSQCFIHGALHCIAYDINTGGHGYYDHVILLFDVGTEVFSAMTLPDCLVSADLTALSVAVIGGLLSVFDRRNTIWVQREYGEGSSWTKMFKLGDGFDLGVAIKCRRYVESLLKSSDGGMTCDCRDLQLLGQYGSVLTRIRAFYVFSYTETLLMLDKQRWFKEEEIKVDVKSKEVTINEVTKLGKKKLEAGAEKAEIDRQDT